MSTRVTFHVLNANNKQSLDDFVCYYLEKIYQDKQMMFVFTSGSDETKQLDDYLWTFKAQSFIPHTTNLQKLNHDNPIFINHVFPEDTAFDLLINLKKDIPQNISLFKNIMEIVLPDASHQDISRDKYRQYKQLQCDLATQKY